MFLTTTVCAGGGGAAAGGGGGASIVVTSSASTKLGFIYTIVPTAIPIKATTYITEVTTINIPVRVFSLPCFDDSTKVSNMAYRPPLTSVPLGHTTRKTPHRTNSHQSLPIALNPTRLSPIKKG